VQALGVALVPPKPAPRKSPRPTTGMSAEPTFVAPPAPQVGAIAQRAQSGRAAPRRVAQQHAGKRQVPRRRDQKEPRAAQYQGRAQCRYRGRAEFVRRPQPGFERIGHHSAAGAESPTRTSAGLIAGTGSKNRLGERITMPWMRAAARPSCLHA
jgi:hypothetical protein